MKKDEFKELLLNGRKLHRPPCLYHRAITGLRDSNDQNMILEKIENKNVDGIEVDLQSTLDGIIIVRHDFAVQTDEGYQWIKEIPYKTFRASVPASDCPTLEEFLSTINNTNKIVDIEIKQPGIASRLITKYKKTGLYKHIIITTMYDKIYEEINECDPEIAWMYGYPKDRGKNLANRWWTQPIVKTIVLFMKYALPYRILKMAGDAPTDFFSFYHKVISSQLVEVLRNNQKFSTGATISLNNDTQHKESIEAMTEMLKCGIDLVKTDFPDYYPEAIVRSQANISH